jgi:hypothetical protein
MTVVLQLVVKLIYRPLRSTPIFRLLPSNEYLLSLAAFSFRQNHNIVFDQLVAPTTHYLKRGEFTQWFDENGFDDVEVTPRNRISWRGRGTRAQ